MDLLLLYVVGNNVGLMTILNRLVHRHRSPSWVLDRIAAIEPRKSSKSAADSDLSPLTASSADPDQPRPPFKLPPKVIKIYVDEDFEVEEEEKTSENNPTTPVNRETPTAPVSEGVPTTAASAKTTEVEAAPLEPNGTHNADSGHATEIHAEDGGKDDSKIKDIPNTPAIHEIANDATKNHDGKHDGKDDGTVNGTSNGLSKARAVPTKAEDLKEENLNGGDIDNSNNTREVEEQG